MTKGTGRDEKILRAADALREADRDYRRARERARERHEDANAETYDAAVAYEAARAYLVMEAMS